MEIAVFILYQLLQFLLSTGLLSSILIFTTIILILQLKIEEKRAHHHAKKSIQKIFANFVHRNNSFHKNDSEYYIYLKVFLDLTLSDFWFYDS